MKTWLTVSEGAEYAGVSRDTIYTACERRELHHARIGGRRSIRLKPDWIDAWLERHARGAEAGASRRAEPDIRRDSVTERQKGGSNMGLYKICKHKGRARDRCDHAWWGSFRGKRVSLAKWANRDIETKAAAGKALDDLRAAIRAGTFDERGLEPPAETSPLTFSTFAEVYKQRHVLAKGLGPGRHDRLPAQAADRALR